MGNTLYCVIEDLNSLHTSLCIIYIVRTITRLQMVLRSEADPDLDCMKHWMTTTHRYSLVFRFISVSSNIFWSREPYIAVTRFTTVVSLTLCREVLIMSILSFLHDILTTTSSEKTVLWDFLIVLNSWRNVFSVFVLSLSGPVLIMKTFIQSMAYLLLQVTKKHFFKSF